MVGVTAASARIVAAVSAEASSTVHPTACAVSSSVDNSGMRVSVLFWKALCPYILDVDGVTSGSKLCHTETAVTRGRPLQSLLITGLNNEEGAGCIDMTLREIISTLAYLAWHAGQFLNKYLLNGLTHNDNVLQIHNNSSPNGLVSGSKLTLLIPQLPLPPLSEGSSSQLHLFQPLYSTSITAWSLRSKALLPALLATGYCSEHLPSVLWHCWLGHLIRKNPSPI